MVVKKTSNQVQINGLNEPFGGSITDLQYSISFSESPSSMTVTFANSTGEYEDPQLSSEESMLVKFGSQSIKMLPVTHRKSKGSDGRTLVVIFEDMSLKYLDKTLVLLDKKHINSLDLPRVIKLGESFSNSTVGQSEVLQRYFGEYTPNTIIKYDIRDLANGIYNAKIPISRRFFNYLADLKGYAKRDDDILVDKSFMRGETGDLRGVLSSVAGELGFVFFWNNSGDNSTVLNQKPNEGYLDFINMKEDVDIDEVRNTIERYVDSCNIKDDSEEISIKGSFLKGAIGSFSTNSQKTKTKSEPFARFKFMDVIESPYTGRSINTREGESKAQKRLLYDLELLMKATQISPDFFAKFVMLKLAAGAFWDEVEEEHQKPRFLGMEFRDQTNAEKEIFATVGKWFNLIKTQSKGLPFVKRLNITRNLAVETLFDFEVQPFALDELERWVIDSSGEANPREKWAMSYAAHSHPFAEALEYDADGDIFFKTWVAILAKNDKRLVRFLKETQEDPLFKKLKFAAENWNRWYYSVQRTSSVTTGSSQQGGEVGGDVDIENESNTTERPSLFTEKTFTERKYSSNVTWAFSDLAVLDSNISDVYCHVVGEESLRTTDADWSEDDYYIAKNGQSQPSIVILPKNVASPSDRWFTVTGFTGIPSVYDFIRYFNDTDLDNGLSRQPSRLFPQKGTRPLGKPVRSSTIGEDENGEVQSRKIIRTGSHKSFISETFGVMSSEEIPLTAERDDWTSRGSTPPSQNAISMSQSTYDDISSMRTSCEEDEYVYPTDLDYGILLHDSYANNSAEQDTSEIDVDFNTIMPSEEQSTEGDIADLRIISNRAVMFIEVPTFEPQELRPATGKFDIANWDEDTSAKPKKSVWGTIWPDDIDKELLKVNLPFSLHPSLNKNRKRINYTFVLDGQLVEVRSSYLPKNEFDKVTSISVENIPFDVGELLDITSRQVPTEFTPCSSSDTDFNVALATERLEEIMKIYVDQNLKQSISRDFTVSGFGFGDDNELPTVFEGLESISVNVGPQGVTTNIKLGNKRRLKASVDLRKRVVLKNLAGAAGVSLIPNDVTKTFSDRFLSAT